MEVGRELMDLGQQIVTALNRNADASEKLLEIAQDEQVSVVEHGPSVCAHCGKLNPEVTLLAPDVGNHGPLDEFMFRVETHCCNRVLYVGSIGFFTSPSQEEVLDALTRQKGGKHE